MEGTLSSIIEQSWRRCEQVYHLSQSCTFDEVKSKGMHKLTHNPFQIEEETQLLITAAHALLSPLIRIMNSTCIALFDKNGLFLHHWGPNMLTNNPYIYTEDVLGTTGTGLALREERPIRLHKDEYYLDILKIFEALSVPIKNAETQLLGCITMLSLSELPARSMEMLTMVSSYISAQIEKPIKCDFNDIIQLLDRFHNGYSAIVSQEGNLMAASQKLLVKLGCRDGHLGLSKITDLIDISNLGSTRDGYGDHYLNQIFNSASNKSLKRKIPAALIQWSNLPVADEPYTILRFDLNKNNSRSNIGVGSLAEDSDVIGQSHKWRTTINNIMKAATTPYSVLLEGESGTGKELLAQLLHRNSLRTGAFVVVNCAALPDNLALSELFGYEEGAFTGALKGGQTGKFERADGGTIFLDEIADMPMEAQRFLLRFLEDRTITRVGGSKTKQVDVRIVAATNKSLEQEVLGGKFRKDLLYRLNGITIKAPPLRQRKDDIVLIANYFLMKACRDLNRNPLQFSDEVIPALVAHDWPGNVRELKNTVERAAVFCDKNIIKGDDIEIFPQNNSTQKDYSPLQASEKEVIAEALRIHQGNISKAASYLGIGRNTLSRKAKRYGLY